LISSGLASGGDQLPTTPKAEDIPANSLVDLTKEPKGDKTPFSDDKSRPVSQGYGQAAAAGGNNGATNSQPEVETSVGRAMNAELKALIDMSRDYSFELSSLKKERGAFDDAELVFSYEKKTLFLGRTDDQDCKKLFAKMIKIAMKFNIRIELTEKQVGPGLLGLSQIASPYVEGAGLYFFSDFKKKKIRVADKRILAGFVLAESSSLRSFFEGENCFHKLGKSVKLWRSSLPVKISSEQSAFMNQIDKIIQFCSSKVIEIKEWINDGPVSYLKDNQFYYEEGKIELHRTLLHDFEFDLYQKEAEKLNAEFKTELETLREGMGNNTKKDHFFFLELQTTEIWAIKEIG